MYVGRGVTRRASPQDFGEGQVRRRWRKAFSTTVTIKELSQINPYPTCLENESRWCGRRQGLCKRSSLPLKNHFQYYPTWEVPLPSQESKDNSPLEPNNEDQSPPENQSFHPYHLKMKYHPHLHTYPPFPLISEAWGWLWPQKSSSPTHHPLHPPYIPILHPLAFSFPIITQNWPPFQSWKPNSSATP